MSLCLALQSDKVIYIGADSRACIEENGVHYIAGDMQKIHRVGKRIIFGSGNATVIQSAIDNYRNSKDKSIDCLKQIAIAAVEKFILDYPKHEKEEHMLDLILANFENDISVVYNITSYDGYKIKKIIGEPCGAIMAAGTHVDEAVKLADKTQNLYHMEDVFQMVYSSVADEQVGNTLTMYKITQNNIDLLGKFKIKDPERKMRHVNWIDDLKLNATDGLKIQRNSGSSASPIWENSFYADADGNLSIIGKFTTGSGNAIFKANENGIALGSGTWADAPFRVDLSGNLTATSANISGNINMTSGTISWANINSDPVATGAASTANSALSVAAAIANGTYSGGTFISGNQIYSPTITGGTVQTQSDGVYPRTVMSVTGNYLGAYKDANNYIRIDPITGAGGLPVMHYGFKGGATTNSASMLLDGSYLKVSAAKSLQLNAIDQVWITSGQAGGSGGVYISSGSEGVSISTSGTGKVTVNGDEVVTQSKNYARFA